MDGLQESYLGMEGKSITELFRTCYGIFRGRTNDGVKENEVV